MASPSPTSHLKLLNPSNHKLPLPSQFTIPKSQLGISALPHSNSPSQSLPRLSSIFAPTTARAAVESNPDEAVQSLCLFGQLDEAIKVFSSSPNHEFAEESYIALITLCRAMNAVPEGCGVYVRLISGERRRCRGSIGLLLGNHLLDMLVGFGKLLSAMKVFNQMSLRDAFSWNVLISGYGQQGFLHESINFYERMIRAGVKPDIYTFPCVLRCCGGLLDSKTGKEIYAHVIRFGYGSEVDVCNALITMYSKCGDLVTARKVFDGMFTKDSISWNAIIAGYFGNGRFNEGIELFRTMFDLSLEPSLFTMTSVISRCDLDLGEALLGYAIKTGFSIDCAVSNSLIKMYSDSNRMEEAEKVFARTKEKNLISWTAMISGYEQNRSPGKALDLFEQMGSNNIDPDEATIVSVLSACASLGQLEIGLKLHKLAKCRGIETDRVACSLIHFYGRLKCMDRAVEVFKKLPDKKNVVAYTTLITGFNINRRYMDSLWYFRNMHRYVQPNEITLINVLDACAELGAVMCGKEIHARALRVGLGFEKCLANSVLATYAKCGRMDLAWSQFRVVNGWNDVVSLNIIIMGHASLREANRAIKLFKWMVKHGRVRPDDITFLSLLYACSRSGMVNKGREYFSLMTKKYSITPNVKHYACMVNLLGRAGLLDEAHDIINEMKFIEPDCSVWGALLDACRIHGRFELGERAVKFLFKSASDNVGYMILCCKFYADLGKWDGVDKVKKLMREKGLEANPGCSWIEIKGSIHAFLTQDKSHPQIQDIQNLLNGLYKRITGNGFDPIENGSEKDDVLCGHSERRAVAFGLINSVPGTPVKVTKNLYMCGECHRFVKLITRFVRREIEVRDTEKFHKFKDGKCSCGC